MNTDIIRASEIGEYVHCNRAWWLGHVQGAENANRAVMEQGTQHHQQHGQRVWRATMMQSAAWILFVAAVVGAVLLLLRLVNLL